jgi:hypothetical protein
MNLHNEIMNLPMKREDWEFRNVFERQTYKEGHRDARHAAAELALQVPDKEQLEAALRKAFEMGAVSSLQFLEKRYDDASKTQGDFEVLVREICGEE